MIGGRQCTCPRNNWTFPSGFVDAIYWRIRLEGSGRLRRLSRVTSGSQAKLPAYTTRDLTAVPLFIGHYTMSLNPLSQY
jgi:hypothetical protein